MLDSLKDISKSFMKMKVLFSALVSSWLKYDMIKCEHHLILPQPGATGLFKERFHQNQSIKDFKWDTTGDNLHVSSDKTRDAF